MRRKPKGQPDAPWAPVPAEILDQFVRQGPRSPQELEAAVRRFKKAIIERALGAELTHHLGHPPGGSTPDDATHHRNGTGSKTVLTDDGPQPIDVPRDREGTFEPRLIAKHERRFTSFDDKVLALYARGMTVREIQAFLAEVLRRAAGQDSRRGDGPEQGDRSRPRRAARWLARHPRPLDRAERGRRRRVRAEAVGPEVPDRRGGLVPGLDPGHPVLRLSPGRAARGLYTTNALESVHAQLRKIIKTRGHFPNDEAVARFTGGPS